jgi:serine/threonine-protein kinase
MRSPTPAPIARAMPNEELTMSPLKSRKVRSITAAACLAGTACASGPQHLPPPPREECPAGWRAGHERFGLVNRGRRLQVYLGPRAWPHAPPNEIWVSEGPATLNIISDSSDDPFNEVTLQGELLFGKGRVYGRFTRARLPDGELVPICMELFEPFQRKVGYPMRPGSTSKKALITNILGTDAVRYFHH